MIGPGEPAGSKLKVAASATDFVSTTFTGAGMGELRTAGWANGYSVSALSKHLYLNRDSPATSNLYLGRNGNMQVLANGNVGASARTRQLPLQGRHQRHQLHLDVLR